MTSVLKVDNIQNSSGTSALSIDSNGVVTQPVVPAFRLEFDGQSFTSSGTKDLLLDTAVDSAGTNNRRFLQGGMAITSGNASVTVPVTGIYQINANCRVDGIGTGYAIMHLKHNNSGTNEAYDIAGTPSTAYEGFALTATLYMEANDTVSCDIYANADTSWSIVASSGYFSGHLVG